VKEKKKKKKLKESKMMDVKKAVEEWEIWDEKEKAKKLVSERFYRWIKIFGKKISERMLIRKMWDHTINLKKGFVPRKEKIYPLFREEREEVRDFIQEQMRERYI